MIKKPESIEEFLNIFINETIKFIHSRIKIGDKVMSLNINQVICDAPAKAFVLNVKAHNSRVGCNTYIEEGVFKDRRMTFLGVNSQLRTDTSFRNKTDKEYHKVDSPLERLPFDMIKNIPFRLFACSFIRCS